MQKQSIVRLSILDEPLHRLENVVLGRKRARILLVVGEDHHVLGLVAKAFGDEGADVVDLRRQCAIPHHLCVS